jgi:hypothetical protein
VKIMTITAEEFIRRFLMHILPDGFMKIRYHGLIANRNRGTKLKLCQQLTGYESKKSRLKDLNTAEIMKRLTGKDVTRCPRCEKGKLQTVMVLAKSKSPPKSA